MMLYYIKTMESRFNEGKRVFFVYPHSVFQENLIQNLVNQEYEIYLIKDHTYINTIIEAYPDAILFLNIDKGLTRDEWEKFIRSLLDSVGQPTFRIGIISYEFEKPLAELYLMELSLPGGYIQLKQSLDKATSIISKTLEANEVRGRRKYVRCQMEPERAPDFNVMMDGALVKGKVLDISSAGMAVSVSGGMEFQKNLLLRDIQINLTGRRLRVSGVVIGFRESSGGPKVFVLLFDKSVDSETRGTIRNFVNKRLQEQLDQKFQSQKAL